MQKTDKSKAYLDAMLNTANKTSNNTISFSTTPYLGLLKELPDINDANSVEVMTPSSSSEYQRVKLTNNGPYNKQLMAPARKVTASVSGSTVTVTISAAAPEDLVYTVTATVGGVDEEVTVTVSKNATTGSGTASGSASKAVFRNGQSVMAECINQDLVVFPECRRSAWTTELAPAIGYGIYDSATGGEPFFWGELLTPLVVNVNTIPIFRVGELRVVVG